MQCKKQWYLHALVGHEDKTLHLVFHHEKIMEALTLHKVNTSNISEEIVSDAFLSFLSFNMTYNKKTLVVTNISSLRWPVRANAPNKVLAAN